MLLQFKMKQLENMFYYPMESQVSSFTKFTSLKRLSISNLDIELNVDIHNCLGVVFLWYFCSQCLNN